MVDKEQNDEADASREDAPNTTGSTNVSYFVTSGESASWTTPTWSFSQLAVATPDAALVPTHFYRSDTARRWERFGYTTDDARSLIEYLNRRHGF